MSKRDKVKKNDIEKLDKKKEEDSIKTPVEESIKADSSLKEKEYVMLCNVKYGGSVYLTNEDVPTVLEALFVSKGFCKLK